MRKIISIHQPETLPWAGYFSKMMRSDEFIILDDVQYKKNNYQNRNRIVHANNPKWWTLPIVTENRLNSTIIDTKIADTVDWRSRNIKILEDAYSKCPYYDLHMPTLLKIINTKTNYLLTFNMLMVMYIRECLSIYTPCVYSSSLHIDSHKSDLVFDICDARGATHYLSGEGGRHYLELDRFKEANIRVAYQKFDESVPYVQRSEEFIPYMSVIDLLMNNSNEDARKYIETSFEYYE